MKLSDQAVGCLMMALQKCLLDQVDIVPILKEMKFAQMDNKELMVENPPDIKVSVPVKRTVEKANSPVVMTYETDNSTGA